jgi:hypothetical protein
LPPAPESPAREDDEFTRQGTPNRFVVVEPLAGTRRVAVTDRRIAAGIAARMNALYDEDTRTRRWSG